MPPTQRVGMLTNADPCRPMRGPVETNAVSALFCTAQRIDLWPDHAPQTAPKGNIAECKRIFVTLSARTPRCPFGIIYCQVYDYPHQGQFKKPRWSPGHNVSIGLHGTAN